MLHSLLFACLVGQAAAEPQIDLLILRFAAMSPQVEFSEPERLRFETLFKNAKPQIVDRRKCADAATSRRVREIAGFAWERFERRMASRLGVRSLLITSIGRIVCLTPVQRICLIDHCEDAMQAMADVYLQAVASGLTPSASLDAAGDRIEAKLLQSVEKQILSPDQWRAWQHIADATPRSERLLYAADFVKDCTRWFRAREIRSLDPFHRMHLVTSTLARDQAGFSEPEAVVVAEWSKRRLAEERQMLEVGYGLIPTRQPAFFQRYGQYAAAMRARDDDALRYLLSDKTFRRLNEVELQVRGVSCVCGPEFANLMTVSQTDQDAILGAFASAQKLGSTSLGTLQPRLLACIDEVSRRRWTELLGSPVSEDVLTKIRIELDSKWGARHGQVSPRFATAEERLRLSLAGSQK